MTKYTPEDLLAMSQSEFHEAVMNDLTETSSYRGPFQHPSVVERTMSTLVEWLWITNAKLAERAEDPTCPPAVYEGTQRFRNHLLAVIDNTDMRIGWIMGAKERQVRKWKQVLFEVVDAIIQGWDDDDILALKIPTYRSNDDDAEIYDLETWHEIRLAKQPDRKRAERAA